MPSDSRRAAQILRGHEERLQQLEQNDQPDLPANLIRVADDESETSDSVTTTTAETNTTVWDTAEWEQSSSGGSVMNWS